jgi:hypothetical protein
MMADQFGDKDEVPIPALAHRAGMQSLGESAQPSDPAGGRRPADHDRADHALLPEL